MSASNEELTGNFREAMSRLSAGVTVITTQIDNRPWGMTISACCSLSMSPPLLLVSLATNVASTKAISENQRFGVNLMAQEQLEIAQLTSMPGKPKFIDDLVADPSAVAPHIHEALAYTECVVQDEIVAGDHTIFIGKPKQVILSNPRDPLIYFDRQYRSLQPQ